MSAGKRGEPGMVCFLQKVIVSAAIGSLAAGFATGAAKADPIVTCGGFAMLGGAQMNCSHTAPTLPPQLCTFSWALMTTSNATTVVEGSFLLAPGVTNAMVYQGAGFNFPLSNPIVICQGRKSR